MRRTRKLINAMDYACSANTLRHAASVGYRDRHVLLLLCDRAIALAPDEGSRRNIERWREVYAQGRFVKIGTYRAEVSTVPVSDEMRREIESALTLDDEGCPE